MPISKIENISIKRTDRGLPIPVLNSYVQSNQFDDSKSAKIIEISPTKYDFIKDSSKILKYCSSLLNYVEPFSLGGLQKTAFYTESSCNFLVGDRVFILNGLYDSDDFISKDNYTKFVDGYRVLSSDGCKVVLDIDYNGNLPYVDQKIEELFIVNVAKDDIIFKYLDSLKTFSGNEMVSIFYADVNSNNINLVGNNILYVDTDLYKNDNFQESGFYYKDSSGGWLRIENLSTIANFDKFMVVGADFSYGSKKFKDRLIYIKSGNTFIFDKSTKKPIISKLNFRYGTFKGIHNDGILGSYGKECLWNLGTWNSGTIVNSIWNHGQMNSKSSEGSRFYVSKLSTNTLLNTVNQSQDYSNNRGFGYNYIYDSTIKEALIYNGNFFNSYLGTYPTTFSTVDNFYVPIQNNYPITIYNGYLSFCDVYTSKMQSVIVNDCYLNNSLVTNSKSIRTQISDSVYDKVEYNSDGGISILDADLWSYPVPGSNEINGVLKLFISDVDYNRLQSGDSFFIDKVNKEYFLSSYTNDDKILLPLETRYFLDTYYNYELSKSYPLSVSVRNKNTNVYKHYCEEIEYNSIVTQYSPKYGTDFYQNSSYVWRDRFDINTQYSIGDYVTYNGYIYRCLSYQPSSDPSDGSGTWTSSVYITGWEAIISWKGDFDPNQLYFIGDFIVYSDGYVYRSLIDQPSTDPSDQSGTWLRSGYYKGPFDNYKNDYSVSDFVYLSNRASVIEDYVYTNILRLSYLGQDNYNTKTIQIPYVKLSLSYTQSMSNYCSIDIDSKIFGWYRSLSSQDTFTDNSKLIFKGMSVKDVPIFFKGNNIKTSDFRSGVMVNSKWISGYNINPFNFIIRKSPESNSEIDIEFDNSDPGIIVNVKNDSFQNGFDIKKGNSVFLHSISYQSPSGDLIPIRGRYIVKSDPIVSQDPNTKIYLALAPENNLNISPGGYFIIDKSQGSNYVSVSRFLLDSSSVESGLFRRTNISNSEFYSKYFNESKYSYDLINVNLLRLVNIIFSENNLSVRSGYINRSHLSFGTFSDGVYTNSILNGAKFIGGKFIESSWVDGIFSGGIFSNSNSMSEVSVEFDDYTQIKSWLSGTFSSGQFYNSVWVNGVFQNGRFYNSHFLAGVWENGILGSKSLKYSDTTFGYYPQILFYAQSYTQSIWMDGVVENALVGGSGSVDWYGGKFNSGELTSFGTSSLAQTTWHNGEFSGGKVTSYVKWKNGTFNNGKFWSILGYDKVGLSNSSTDPIDYGWENGIFNSGEFGNGSTSSNSTWFMGQFLDGTFQGRYWNNGYFIGGNFNGSGILSPTPSKISSDGESEFVESFYDNYYGLWNDGYVVSNIGQISLDTLPTFLSKRMGEEVKTTNKKSNFSNMLWKNGTFSNDLSTISDSIWLNGSFLDGIFSGGVFNSYVDRSYSSNPYNKSFGSSSVWYNGVFSTGSFYYSTWNNGTFKNGYISGAIWKNGTFEYGTADNILWLDGNWKNGNWNGSPFSYTLFTQSSPSSTFSLVYGREKDIILNISNNNNLNNGLHLFNVFSYSSIVNTISYSTFSPSNTHTYSVTEKYEGKQWSYSSSSKGFLSYPSSKNFQTSGWVTQSSLRVVTSTLNGQPMTELIEVNNLKTNGGDLYYINPENYKGYNIFNLYSSDSAPSAMLNVLYSTSKNVFTESNMIYTINMVISSELSSTNQVEFFVGGLSSSVFNLSSDTYKYSIGTSSYVDNYPKLYSINLVYSTTQDLLSSPNGKYLSLRKNTRGIIRIYSIKVDKQKVEYHPDLNNSIYGAIDLKSKQVTIPGATGISITTYAFDGNIIGLNFGNGSFKQGVWNNGVWNNGFRSNNIWFPLEDDTLISSDVVSKGTYKIGDNTWKLTIQLINGISDVLTLSSRSKVSISNISIIDTSSRRLLIRDPLEIISIDTNLNQLSLKVISTSDIREIKRDSLNHLIYVSKNIWANGVFLNGFFSGIFLNGLIKGYPSTTIFGQSHIVDGYFDGGRFKSSFVLPDIDLGVQGYNDGLVQNFTFKDNNTSVHSRYGSWMDINYSTQSFVNINKDSTFYQSNLSYGDDVIEYDSNLYGYPSVDVISSDSYFKDINSPNVNRYKLGIGYGVYSNLIPNSGNFLKSYSSENPKIGISGFFDIDMWTFSSYSYSYGMTSVGSTTSLYSNVSPDTSKVLHLFSDNTGSSKDLIVLKLKNLNASTKISRYYKSSIITSTSSYGNILLDTSLGENSFNHALTTSTKKEQYFYNKKEFDLILTSTQSTANIYISNISMEEVDMIPFFSYATPSNIDFRLISPYFGTSPMIDYTNQKIDFIGSLDLAIGYQIIKDQNLPNMLSGSSFNLPYKTLTQTIES